MRRGRTLLVALTIAVLLPLVNPPAASAGDLGRTYHSFHAQGDVNNPWFFQACVKLVHEPTTHTWWATGSNTACCTGMSVLVYAIHIDDLGGTIRTGPSSGIHSDFATSTSDPLVIICGSSRTIRAVVGVQALWPNNVLSSQVTWPTDFFTVGC